MKDKTEEEDMEVEVEGEGEEEGGEGGIDLTHAGYRSVDN